MGLKCLIFDCYIYLVFSPEFEIYIGGAGGTHGALVSNPAPVLWKRHYCTIDILLCTYIYLHVSNCLNTDWLCMPSFFWWVQQLARIILHN